jgi:REJ domain
MHISKSVQLEESWPDQFPAAGDEVFLAEPGAFTATLSREAECKELTLGSNELILQDTGLSAQGLEQVLRLADGAVLTLGLGSEPLDCKNTIVRGEGIFNGTNKGPNYVFIESRDAANLSPGEGSPDGKAANDYWIIEMRSPSDEVFLDSLQFNYTLADGDDGVFFLTYLASITGFNFLSVFCDNRQNPVPGSPFEIGFLELKPPTVDPETGGGGAVFCEKGVCAMLTFSLNTNQAGLQGHFDCAELLDEATTGSGGEANFERWLGDGGYCYWRSPSVLIIVFGNNALPTATTQSTLGIRGGILAGAPPFITEVAPPSEVQLALPASPMAPAIMVDAPRHLPSCAATLSLDTRSSTGTGGRDWAIGVSWSVSVDSGSGGNVAAVQAALSEAATAAAASDAVLIAIDASLLEPDVDYVFRASATNWMGVAGSGETTVARGATDAPTVQILGGAHVYMRQDTQLFLDTRVANPCGVDVASFSFLWRGGNNETRDLIADVIEPLDFFDEETRVKSLVVPAGALETGTLYEFIVDYNVTLADGSNRTMGASDSIIVEPVLGPVWAIISSGDRVVDKRDQFELDPVASIDTADIDEPFVYTWACVRNTAPFIGRKCFDKPDLYLQSTRVDVPGELLQGGQYIFTLLLQKGERNSSATSIVTVIDTEEESSDGGVPFVLIDDLGIAEWPVNEPLVLSGTVTTDSRRPLVNVTWTVTPDDFNFTDPDNFVVAPSGAPTEPTIILKPNVLFAGVDYKFQLSAANVLGTGSATITLRGDEPPLGGRCSATPLNRTGDDYNWQRLECMQWEDDRKHTGRYVDWTFVSPSTGREVPLTLDHSLGTAHEVLLPPGTELAYAYVADAVGGATRRVVAVTSPPPRVVDADIVDNVFDPTIEGIVAQLASIGAHDEVANYAYYFFDQLDVVEVFDDPERDNRTSVRCCETVIYDDVEALARRRARHLLANAVRDSLLATLTEQSFRTFAELTAYMTTPSNDNDENSMLDMQRFPFEYMEWMSEHAMSDSVAKALMQSAWNQVRTTPFVSFSPGRHIRLAQAIVDFVNLFTMGLQSESRVIVPPRYVSWKTAESVSLLARVSELSQVENRVLQVRNVTVDLGGVPARARSLLAKRDNPLVSWSLTVFDENVFYYEQSSEGINSPIVYVQLVDTQESAAMDIENLDMTDPLRLMLPTRQVYNPLQRMEFPEQQSCVWWLEPDIAANEEGYFWTSQKTVSGLECRYSDQLELPNTNSTRQLAFPICQCNHMTEFATRIELGSFAPDGLSTTNDDFGWYIFAGILGALLLAIIIWGAYYIHRWRIEQAQKAEEAFIQPPAPTMGDRAGIDAFSDF